MTLGAIGMVVIVALMRLRWPRTIRNGYAGGLGTVNAAIRVLLRLGRAVRGLGDRRRVSTPCADLQPGHRRHRAAGVRAGDRLRVGGLVLGSSVRRSWPAELELRADPSGLIGALAVVLAAIRTLSGASYTRYRIAIPSLHSWRPGTLIFAALDMWVLALVADGGVILPMRSARSSRWYGSDLGSFVAYVLFFFLIENIGATLATMVTYVFPWWASPSA